MGLPMTKVKGGGSLIALPHVSYDEISWRDEEVVHPLESCANGMMNFTHTGLRNYLQT